MTHWGFNSFCGVDGVWTANGTDGGGGGGKGVEWMETEDILSFYRPLCLMMADDIPLRAHCICYASAQVYCNTCFTSGRVKKRHLIVSHFYIFVNVLKLIELEEQQRHILQHTLQTDRQPIHSFIMLSFQSFLFRVCC